MGQPPNAQEAVPIGLDIPPTDWQQTPPSVQTLVLTLLKRLEAIAARLKQDSTTSQRPPSADSPYKKARNPVGDAPPRKAGGQPGHPGHRQSLLAPIDTRVLTPHQCACGHTALTLPRPYHTHQVIELPVIQMDVLHFVLQEAWCPVCAAVDQGTGPSCAYRRVWSTVDRPRGGNRWDPRNRPPHDPGLLCLGPPGAAESGSHPEDARSGYASHRAALWGHGEPGPPGSCQLH